jgi:hypothetical protein
MEKHQVLLQTMFKHRRYHCIDYCCSITKLLSDRSTIVGLVSFEQIFTLTSDVSYTGIPRSVWLRLSGVPPRHAIPLHRRGFMCTMRHTVHSAPYRLQPTMATMVNVKSLEQLVATTAVSSSLSDDVISEEGGCTTSAPVVRDVQALTREIPVLWLPSGHNGHVKEEPSTAAT